MLDVCLSLFALCDPVMGLIRETKRLLLQQCIWAPALNILHLRFRRLEVVRIIVIETLKAQACIYRQLNIGPKRAMVILIFVVNHCGR